MHHAHIQAILQGVIPEVKAAIATATKPLLDRIEALESRGPEKGERGLDGKDGAPGLDGKDGAPGRDGVDGKDGEPGPQGDRGEKGESGERGEQGPAGEAGPAGEQGPMGEAGPQGEKGIDGAAGPAGERGETGPAGIQGEKGVDGRDGQPGVPGIAGRDGKDGLNGKDGQDGFSLEDFDIKSEDGGRTLVMTFTRGDLMVKREMKTDVVLDRGVWREGPFQKGDGVSFGGSFFIAQEDTTDKPETSKAWRLAIKRGRDGKDGRNGEKGDRGPEGKAGRDLTHMTLDGVKY